MPHGSVRKNIARVHGHIVVLTPGHYTALDNAIIDHHAKTIGAIGVAIYAVLSRYANRKTGECWPTIGCIAHKLDLARSTVKVYVRKLEAAGLIAIEERYTAVGDQDANRYRLLDPAPKATEQRGKDREAQALRGLMPALSPHEGGRPSVDPPGRAADGFQLLSTQNKENQVGGCSSTQGEGTKNQARTCEHAPEERLHFGQLALCPHCWAQFDQLSGPADVATGDRTEGVEVPSAVCAA